MACHLKSSINQKQILTDRKQMVLVSTDHKGKSKTNAKQQTLSQEDINQSLEVIRKLAVQFKPSGKNELQTIKSSTLSSDSQITKQSIQNIYQKSYLPYPNQDKNLPYFNLKNMYDLSQELKKKLQINIEKLIIEISYLENQIYDDSEVSHFNHPSYQVNECLESMNQLNILIENNINNLQLVNGRNNIISFYMGEESRQIQHFKEFQKTWFELKERFKCVYDYEGYEFQEDNFYHYEQINAFDQSPNNKFLICCQYKTLTIWNILDSIKEMNFKYLREISALTYCDDSDNFILGDKEGYIALFDTSSKKQEPKKILKVHQSIVCQIITKDIQLCYSSSRDNTIKLTDLTNLNILLVIDNIISCFMGFDYSSDQNFILAPNNKKEVIIFNSNDGEQIACANLQVQENEFINIQLSQNQRQALVNLFKQCKIFLIDINIDLKLLQVQKQLNLESECFRLCWCLNDQAFAYLIDGNLLVRYFGNPTFPLILESEINQDPYVIFQPSINKFDPNLDQIFVSQSNSIYFFEKDNQYFQKRK